MVAAQFLAASGLISLALAAAASSGDNSLTLQPGAIQKGSQVDGTNSIGAAAGQAASDVSFNNFINFCDQHQPLTNGLQITTGSCNGIPMGQIPAKDKMISLVFLNPQNAQTIPSGQTFNITLQVNNLQAGSFTDADATYYAAPAKLNGAGILIGHVHVTVQDVGKSLNPTKPPDPTKFAFFKGIDDAGNGQGLLSATVTGGLPPSNYRVCSITSGSNHQCANMPVAQRGSYEDCRYFTVNGNNNTPNAASNGGAKGIAAADAAQSAVNAGPGFQTAAGQAAAATTSAAAASGGKKGGNGGNGGSGAKAAGGGGGAKAAGGGGKGAGKASTTTTTSAAAAETTAAATKASGAGASKASGGAQAEVSGKAGGAGGKGGKSGAKRDCNTERRARQRRRYVS